MSSYEGSSDKTTAYARAVVDGETVSGELAIAAARRHLADLENGEDRNLKWDVELAETAIRFFPAMLTITAGAKVGEPFTLLPWHVFVVGSIFGWRKKSGRMRFRNAWLETGKGQAKSPLMAGIGLYMGGFYGVRRAAIYSIGQDRRTANVLFEDAVAMCRANFPGTPEDETDSLASNNEVLIRGEGDNAWKIEFPSSGSKFQSLANGEAISGPKPTAVLADEIHEFKSNNSIEVWKQAIAKMPGDAIMLLGTNTPASTQIVGTEYSEYFQKVANGEIEDDEAFGFIARVDKADRDTVFDNEDVWKKSLPALDVTFPIDNIRGQVATAKLLLSTALSVKRLYFGIPTGAVEFWIAEDAWMAVQGRVDENEMHGLKCWLSLDLSKKNDLTALSACWVLPGEGGNPDKHFVKTWYWTTRDGLADRSRADATPYDQWVEKGFIEAVPGAVIDKTFVAAEVQRLYVEHDVEFMAFDTAQIADFIAACETIGFPVWRFEDPEKPEGEGLKMVAHAQGKMVRYEDRQLTMPRSIERLEDRILEKTVVIDSSPVTYACAANAMIDSDGAGNRCFDKKRSRGRIDGMVTVAMSVGAATNELGKDDGPSVYETRGILMV